MDALSILSELFNDGLGLCRKFGCLFNTSHRSRSPVVTNVTFIIVFCASARLTHDNSFMIFSVIALLILLASHVSDLLPEPAFVVTMSTIIRSPLFIVGFISIRLIYTLTLGCVKLGKINIYDSSLIVHNIIFIWRASARCRCDNGCFSSINNEVLRSCSRLRDYVMNFHVSICNFNPLPCFSIVPSELNTLSRTSKFRRDN